MPGTGILAGTDLLMSVKETAAAWQGSMTWCHQPEQYKPQTPVDYAGGVKQQHTAGRQTSAWNNSGPVALCTESDLVRSLNFLSYSYC